MSLFRGLPRGLFAEGPAEAEICETLASLSSISVVSTAVRLRFLLPLELATIWAVGGVCCTWLVLIESPDFLGRPRPLFSAGFVEGEAARVSSA